MTILYTYRLNFMLQTYKNYFKKATFTKDFFIKDDILY